MNYNPGRAVDLPASKSIAARFLVATYFAGTLPSEPDFTDSEDLEVLQRALLSLYTDEEPIDFGGSPLDIRSSGTALRFITAVCASSPDADFVITGSERVCSRPMQPLLDVLRMAGAEIDVQGPESFGPYRVRGKKLKGGEFSIRGDISSQFISALMLVAPSWETGLKLNFTTPLASSPYIAMTARVMENFGLNPMLHEDFVEIKNGEYKDPGNFRVEADWSAAAFFYEAAALCPSPISIAALAEPEKSIQGDARAAEFFGKIGVISDFNPQGATVRGNGETPNHVELNFYNNPDMVLPYAVACALKGINFNFSGVKNLRFKESDRIEALSEELRKLGILIEAGDDYISWDGSRCDASDEPIDPHADHRVAMAFAMAALKTGKVRIAHSYVVEKSFAGFWQQLPKIGLECTLSDDNIMTVTHSNP